MMQKYVSFYKRHSLLGESGSDSYLASQCKGNSGLEKDLNEGWLIKWLWEDSSMIVFILEKL